MMCSDGFPLKLGEYMVSGPIWDVNAYFRVSKCNFVAAISISTACAIT